MRILVVEDEPKLAATLRQGLQEQGYAADITYDGEEGLALAEIIRYDLIVLDLMLPKLDGVELCRRLRAQRQTVPVLMLTARDAIDDRVKGLDAGADDYLVKPFVLRELLARVRALLRRNSASRDALLRAGDIELDPASREVRRGGIPVMLTSKEYALLEYFMRNPNRVLSRGQIAEHIWGMDFDAVSNVVNVYVCYLRRKLGDHRAPHLLQTIRGVGYQLKAPSA